MASAETADDAGVQNSHVLIDRFSQDGHVLPSGFPDGTVRL